MRNHGSADERERKAYAAGARKIEQQRDARALERIASALERIAVALEPRITAAPATLCGVPMAEIPPNLLHAALTTEGRDPAFLKWLETREG